MLPKWISRTIWTGLVGTEPEWQDDILKVLSVFLLSNVFISLKSYGGEQ